MDSGDPRAPLGSTDGDVGITVHILEPFLCQLVDVGSFRMGVAVAADPVDVVVFAGQPEKVGAVCCRRARA
jgi:hypothetical protein